MTLAPPFSPPEEGAQVVDSCSMTVLVTYLNDPFAGLAASNHRCNSSTGNSTGGNQSATASFAITVGTAPVVATVEFSSSNSTTKGYPYTWETVTVCVPPPTPLSIHSEVSGHGTNSESTNKPTATYQQGGQLDHGAASSISLHNTGSVPVVFHMIRVLM
jgi:hypothetical protein